MNTDQAFPQFYKDHYRPLYYFALRLLDDEETCRDIVNDAMEHIYLNRDAGTIAKWDTYAFSFVRSHCIDYLRRQKVKQRYQDYYIRYAEQADYADLLDEDDRLTAVMARIETMPEKMRLVIKLHYLEGMKYKEVAQQLGLSADSVHKYVVKAMKMLREDFANKSATSLPEKSLISSTIQLAILLAGI